MAFEVKRCVVLLACAVLVASIAVTALAQDKIRLEMTPSVGDFMRYDMKMNMEVKIEGDFSSTPEQVQAILANPIQLAVDMAMSQKVQKVMENGDFAVGYGFDKLQLSAMGMSFDAAQFMPKEMMGQMPSAVLSKRGTLVGFLGPEGEVMTFADMMKMMPGGAMPADVPAEAKEMIAKIGEALEEIIGCGGYPDKDLSVGDSWKTPGLDKIMAFFGISNVQDQNTLKAVQEFGGSECAVVENEGSVEFEWTDVALHLMKTFGIEAMVTEMGGEEAAGEFAKVMGLIKQLEVPVKGEGTSTMMVRLSDGMQVENKGSMNAVLEAKNLLFINEIIKAEAGEGVDPSKLPKIGDSYKITITGKFDMAMSEDQSEPEG